MMAIAIRGLVELLALCFDLRIGFTINRGRFDRGEVFQFGTRYSQPLM
jgi:hypothetical protein